MENCIGRKQRLVEKSIATATRALNDAMRDVQTIKKRNGRCCPKQRQQLKAKVANSLNHLHRAIATAERQNMEEIDTDGLRAKILEYEEHFAKVFPNKAVMPKKSTRVKHQFFNRHTTFTTPCWRMGPPK